jgi:hypothetical protein
VIRHLKARPEIDGRRIVVAGQSFGGWNTLAVGTLGLSGVTGLVNFVGGVRVSTCPTNDVALGLGAAALGAAATVPSIWFYGDNDKLFSSATWRDMYARYIGNGGRAELVAFGNFMDDSHQLLSHPEGLKIWVPKVDAFLARIGLPAEPVQPAYMPTAFPPATHFALIDDADKVPYLNDKGRAAYRTFLGMPFSRAFVVAPNGSFAMGHGGFDVIARMLALCGQHQTGCQLYAVDSDVVWSGPKEVQAHAGSSPTVQPIFRRSVLAGATALLDFSYSVNPDCTARGIPRIWVVEPPAHGLATVGQREEFPHFPANHPLSGCNSIKVPGTIVAYRPADGYVGNDELKFEEITLDNRDLLFQIAITVK